MEVDISRNFSYIGGNDKYIWKDAFNGEHSIKAAYISILRSKQTEPNEAEKIRWGETVDSQSPYEAHCLHLENY